MFGIARKPTGFATFGVLVATGLLLASCAGTTVGENQTGASALTKEILLATTTSTVDSGLLDVLLPVFEQESGYNVKPVGVGTGAALALGAQRAM